VDHQLIRLDDCYQDFAVAAAALNDEPLKDLRIVSYLLIVYWRKQLILMPDEAVEKVVERNEGVVERDLAAAVAANDYVELAQFDVFAVVGEQVKAMTAEEIVEEEEVAGVDGPWVETWFHFEFGATIFA